jgi:hypothetical protein
MSRDIERYSQDYMSDYGFEKTLVTYRQRVVIDQLLAIRPATVLEIGCGADLLYERYLEQELPVKNWIVVEPGGHFCQKATQASLPGMKVIKGFFEESVDVIMDALNQPPDFVICSGLLNEVSSAQALLESIRITMDQHSVLHVNVANAASFHRQLALVMALIPTLDTMSDRNLLLQQHRVYDFDSLISDLERTGFTIHQKGGYFTKPFTHAQMDSIAPLLGDAVMEGLFELGKHHPEMACEIFVNAGISE